MRDLFLKENPENGAKVDMARPVFAALSAVVVLSAAVGLKSTALAAEEAAIIQGFDSSQWLYFAKNQPNGADNPSYLEGIPYASSLPVEVRRSTTSIEGKAISDVRLTPAAWGADGTFDALPMGSDATGQVLLFSPHRGSSGDNEYEIRFVLIINPSVSGPRSFAAILGADLAKSTWTGNREGAEHLLSNLGFDVRRHDTDVVVLFLSTSDNKNRFQVFMNDVLLEEIELDDDFINGNKRAVESNAGTGAGWIAIPVRIKFANSALDVALGDSQAAEKTYTLSLGDSVQDGSMTYAFASGYNSGEVFMSAPEVASLGEDVPAGQEDLGGKAAAAAGTGSKEKAAAAGTGPGNGKATYARALGISPDDPLSWLCLLSPDMSIVSSLYLCYEYPTSGYYCKAGTCWGHCYPDEIDVGALCRKKCAVDYQEVIGICWKGAKSYVPTTRAKHTKTYLPIDIDVRCGAPPKDRGHVTCESIGK